MKKKNQNRGHLALMMLSEIAFECFDELIKFMPIILQFSVLGLDNADYNVNSQCKELLYRLVHLFSFLSVIVGWREERARKKERKERKRN